MTKNKILVTVEFKPSGHRIKVRQDYFGKKVEAPSHLLGTLYPFLREESFVSSSTISETMAEEDEEVPLSRTSQVIKGWAKKYGLLFPFPKK